MARKKPKDEPSHMTEIFAKDYSRVTAYYPLDKEGKPIKHTILIRLEEARNQPKK